MWLIILISFLIILFLATSSNLTVMLTMIVKKAFSKDIFSFFTMFLAFCMFATFLYLYIFRIHFDQGINHDIYYLPINRIQWTISEILFQFLDFWTLLLTVVFFSIIILLEVFNNFFQYFLAGIIFAVFLLGVNLTVRFFIVLIEYLIRWYGLHGVKLAAGTNLILIICVALFISLLYVTRGPASLPDFFGLASIVYLPPGLTAAAMVSLAGFGGRWLLHLLGISGYAIVLFFLVFLLITKELKGRQIPRELKSDEVKTSRLQHKNNIISVLISKEILYLIRSTRIKVSLFFGIIFTFLYLNTGLFGLNGFSYLNLILLDAGALYLTFEAISNWLYDGTAVRFYFYSALNLKSLILTKNLAFFFWIIVIEILNLACGFIVKPALMRFDLVLFAPIFLTGFYWMMIIPLNFIAFKWPKKVSYDNFFSKSMSASTTTLFMLPVLILFLYFYIPFFFNSFVAKLLLCFMALLSMGIYYLSLNIIQNQLLQYGDHFIETVC